jgi:histidine triad (HIT) family protein
MDCLFCRIVNGQVPADKIYEDDEVIAFHDIHPKAPIHILVIPKKHVDSLAHATDQDRQRLGQLLLAVSKLAKDQELTGYKTIINTGRDGGQVINHLHLHLLGGSIEGLVE